MRKIPVVLVVLLVAVLVGAPAKEASAQVRIFELINTFYSDYFVTVVGGYEDYCDGNTYYWGIPDGSYRTLDKTNCTTGAYTHQCYQKVSGSWTLIACP